MPCVVENLLQAHQRHEVEVTIRPERVSRHYTVEWQYLEYDREAVAWTSVADFPAEDHET